MKIALVLLFASLMASAQEMKLKDLHQDYIKKCGGKIYSKCDDADGLNQATLFVAAMSEAKKENKLLVAIVGGDWCGPCIGLDQSMKERPDLLERLDKEYVQMKLFMPSKTGQALLQIYGLKVYGYPSALIFNPKTNQFVKGLLPTLGIDAYVKNAETISAAVKTGAPIPEMN